MTIPSRFNNNSNNYNKDHNRLKDKDQHLLIILLILIMLEESLLDLVMLAIVDLLLSLILRIQDPSIEPIFCQGLQQFLQRIILRTIESIIKDHFRIIIVANSKFWKAYQNHIQKEEKLITNCNINNN
jgi:hypothetical protein